MKVDKVTYTKSYSIGPFLQEKVGFEASIDPEDIPENVLNYLKVMADDWHKENNPPTGMGIELPGGPMNIPIPDRYVDRGNPKEALAHDINSCIDIKVLESYKLLVKNSPDLQEVYEKKLAELKK